MNRKLAASAPEITVEGIIITHYSYKGEIVCITYFDPVSGKHGIGVNFDDIFKISDNESDIQSELDKISERLN